MNHQERRRTPLKKSHWKESEIEDMLRKLPQVKDNRSKKAVYSGIDGKQRKRRIKKWIPLIAGLASLFMIIIASALNTGKEDSEEKKVDIQSNGKLAISESEIIMDKQEQHDVKSNEKREENQGFEGNSREETTFKSKAQQVEKVTHVRAIYPEDLQGKSTITLGVPDDQYNFIVPISFVVNHFDETDALTQVINKMSTINEESYGLSDYFPLDAKATHDLNKNTVHIELGTGSKLLDEDILFLRTIEETLSYLQIDKMTFTTEGKSGASVVNAGLLKEEEIPSHKNRTFFLYQTGESSSRFFVPSNMDYQKLEEALQAAKEAPAIEGISSAIPEDLKWKNLSFDGDLVTVELAKEVKLEDDSKSLQAMEVILFTAKDFGYKKVKFKNAPIEKVGSLNLLEEITVPLAPNQVN